MTAKKIAHMSTCIINGHSFDIDIFDSPVTSLWLELNAGKELIGRKKYFPQGKRSFSIFKNLDNLYNLLTQYRPLWEKMRFKELIIDKRSQLLKRECLANIHLKMVAVQRQFKKSTNFLNLNTNGQWDYIYEILHLLEVDISSTDLNFDADDVDISHDSKIDEKYRDWGDHMSPEQWAVSTTFERYHLELKSVFLGRLPWECFSYAPENWQGEGCLGGNIPPCVHVRAVAGQQQSVPLEFAAWSKNNALPVIGPRIPLANFCTDEFLTVISDLGETNSLIIQT
jgi:hypothetical protein